MTKAKTYPLTVTVVEKSYSGYTCECDRHQKVDAHFTFLSATVPPVVLAESYLCNDCAVPIREGGKS